MEMGLWTAGRDDGEGGLGQTWSVVGVELCPPKDMLKS